MVNAYGGPGSTFDVIMAFILSSGITFAMIGILFTLCALGVISCE